MTKYELLNGSNLAYIGDAYYELAIREYLINQGITKNRELKKASLKFVSATAHEKIFENIKDQLTDEEMKIFMRGRNGAPTGHRKNVDRGAYVISSGIEAVIGYLYLTHNMERLQEIILLMIKEGEST